MLSIVCLIYSTANFMRLTCVQLQQLITLVFVEPEYKLHDKNTAKLHALEVGTLIVCDQLINSGNKITYNTFLNPLTVSPILCRVICWNDLWPVLTLAGHGPVDRWPHDPDEPPTAAPPCGQWPHSRRARRTPATVHELPELCTTASRRGLLMGR